MYIAMELAQKAPLFGRDSLTSIRINPVFILVILLLSDSSAALLGQAWAHGKCATGALCSPLLAVSELHR